jgi:hypothetical protein
MKFLFRASVLAVSISLVLTATAKIAPLEPVPPVESNGVRYSADREATDQYIVATEIATRKQLWRVRVVHTHIRFWKEADVQWVFITNLKLVNDALLVRDSRARCYSVIVKNHRVSKAVCGMVFAK